MRVEGYRGFGFGLGSRFQGLGLVSRFRVLGDPSSGDKHPYIDPKGLWVCMGLLATRSRILF